MGRRRGGNTMSFEDVRRNTVISGFGAASPEIDPGGSLATATILGLMEDAYRRSPLARGMFENWVRSDRTINISFNPNKYRAFAGTGRVEIDLQYINNLL